MSTQKGNVTRTRSQKYQNKSKFKNDLHDTSHIMKNINKLEITNVCSRCKSVIEWKIKYKKYKQIKNPGTCVRCHNRNVKHAYHTLCGECAINGKVCPKCGKNKELVESITTFDPEIFLQSGKVKTLMQGLTERKRRMFYRLLDNAQEKSMCSEEELLEKLESLQINAAKSNSSFDERSGTDSSSECIF